MTADVPVVEVVAVDAVLDALDTPTSSEVYSAVEPFSNSAVAAAAAARAIAGGGGGSAPVFESGYYSGSIAAAGTRPPWDVFDIGDDVLDRTNPLQPEAREDGLFLISAEVQIANAVVGAECSATLIFDYGNDGALITGTGILDPFNITHVFVSGSWVLAAGEKIRLTVTPDASATTVQLKNALVSRIGLA